ncbi:MAG TPA: hypothetical protein VJ735_20270 [Actinomycetes bacterium]|nr:hypothetical protein [Actinomycetes bacterium]
MRRLFWSLLLAALWGLTVWTADRQGYRRGLEAGVADGYEAGRIDGDNEGFLQGQRSVVCPR